MTSDRNPTDPREGGHFGTGDAIFELRPKPPVEPGGVVADKYRVDGIIAFGGMGVVCSATHLELGTSVAIKFVRSERVDDERTVARFLTEARAAAQLRSQHTCRVVDCGRLDSGSPYMVMELLEGADLRAILSKQGPLPIDEAVMVTMQACESLAEAHGREVVHRDIKPENLFLTQAPDGAPLVKVLDFGISRQLNRSRASRNLTEPTESIGSPYHMSPEQMIDPTQVDARTDIWSLGVVLYELLTGRLPFSGESTPQICALVMTGQPLSLRELRADIPEQLEAVVLRCLEKDRERRFADVAALSAALQQFGGSASSMSAARVERIIQRASATSSLPAAPDSDEAESVEPPEGDDGVSSEDVPGVPRRRSSLRWIVGLSAVVAVGAYSYHQVTEVPREREPTSINVDRLSDPDAAVVEKQTESPPPLAEKASGSKTTKRPGRFQLPDPEKLLRGPSPPSSSLYPEIRPVPDMPSDPAE